jgi:Reverse transcriptase (RNA-dependent DNA polymerase)
MRWISKTKFMSLLESTDWTFTDELVAGHGPDIAYNAFLLKYKKLYDQAFPPSSNQNKWNKRVKQPWMTKALLKSCKKKSRLYKNYLRNPTDTNKCTFVNYRNKFKQIRNECEATYYADCFLQCGNNLNKTWKIIKQILNSNDESCSPDAFVINGQLTEIPGDVANAFNDYFINIGPNLASKIPKTNVPFTKFMPNPPLCSFGILPTSVQEITKITNDLKTSGSSGSDDINSAIVKLSLTAIAAPLTNIINSSFSTGVVPNQLKIAKVIPIYKSGDKTKINNYRPISVLPFFSKIFEKLMYNRVTDYLKKHCLLSPSQFGFQQGLSTYMALLEMQSNIVDAMDCNKFSLGIFFDLSKAFDTVSHGILAKKLEYYGLRGISQQWFTDYLSNRTQFVNFKGSKSQTMKITCGVPQGSILGPLLFLLFINDIAMTSLILKLGLNRLSVRLLGSADFCILGTTR